MRLAHRNEILRAKKLGNTKLVLQCDLLRAASRPRQHVFLFAGQFHPGIAALNTHVRQRPGIALIPGSFGAQRSPSTGLGQGAAVQTQLREFSHLAAHQRELHPGRLVDQLARLAKKG
jgi:hypothetical protein